MNSFFYDHKGVTVRKNLLPLFYKALILDGLDNSNITVKKSNLPSAGLGVFAKKNFKKYDIVEFCYGMVYKNRASELEKIKDLSILKYSYQMKKCDCKECEEKGPLVLQPFGYGCIYNSAESGEKANIIYFANTDTFPMLCFVAKKDIKKGEELLTWWGNKYYNAWCTKNEK